MTILFNVQHRDVASDAVQAAWASQCAHSSWPAVAAFQRARLATGTGPLVTRQAIPAGVREIDRRPLYTERGFYVVYDVALRRDS